jgi:cell division septation protein DedD
MASSQDTEITLGTGKLLVLFFGLVAICAVFFALGYTLGKKSDPAIAAGAAVLPQTSGNVTKPGSAPASSAPSMTFYKSVEQKEPGPELTAASDSRSQTGASGTTTPAPAEGAADPTTPVPPSVYLVQVAAVSKQDDAEALVEALKKKEYPAFVAPAVATDKLFRVQLGPFADIKDAEVMRGKLVSDGYNPILKK